MHRALWLLTGLQLRGWLRYAKKNASSLRGVLILVLGVCVFSCSLLPLLLGTAPASRPDPGLVERIGPLALLAGCLLNLLSAIGERAISFRPAEVDFLFPGPFTRRQLLFYKVTGIVLAALFQSAFALLFVYRLGRGIVPAYVGMVLLLLFFQFFTLTLTMLASAIGARVYSLGRRIALLVIGLILAAWAVQVVRNAGDPLDALTQLEQSPAWQVARTPLAWFVKAFQAQNVWPDFALYGSLALLVDLLLAGFVFALDAHYLEASAAASERQYRRMQRLRSGQGVLAAADGGKARFTLPLLPRLGGVGPVVWRQVLVVARSYLPLLLLLGLGGVCVSIALTAEKRGEEAGQVAPILAAMLLGFPVFLTPTVVCDFRGDLDRIEVLKALPIRGVWLAVGQLLAPTLVVVTVQAVVVVLLQLVLGQVESLMLAVPLLALPVNFILFGVENLLFLLFPVRVVQTSPGDFQTSGRYLLVFIAKFLCLFPIGLVGGIVALLIHWATGSLPAALAGAWLVAFGCGIGLVPLVVLAFDRFDVAKDTPV